MIGLNRVVWVLWLQGFQNAPEIVRLCTKSWKVTNPRWRVVELDRENLSDFVDDDSLNCILSLRLEPQKTANLIRLYLLSRHGGVWADGTCLCRVPLDDWIEPYLVSGFFAFKYLGPAQVHFRGAGRAEWFRRRKTVKLLANWFLAAQRDNYLASTFYREHLRFFTSNHFPLQNTPEGEKRIVLLRKILSYNSFTSEAWASPLVMRLTRAYPYFIFHYHFARLVRADRRCEEIWKTTPALRATAPLKLHKLLTTPITDSQIEEFESRKTPLYKLQWRLGADEIPEGSVLDYVLKSVTAELASEDRKQSETRLS